MSSRQRWAFLAAGAVFFAPTTGAWAADGAPPMSVKVPAFGAAKPAGAKPVSEGDKLLREASTANTGAKTEEDYNKILDLCEQGLKADPSPKMAAYAKTLESWCHDKRGELRATAGHNDEAVSDFNSAIELDATRWKPYYNRGSAFARQGKYDEALTDLNKAIDMNRGYKNAWFNAAEIRAAQANWPKALNNYSEVIRLDPQDAAAYLGRADTLVHLGRLQEAMADYNQAVNLQPRSALFLTSRGEAASVTGDYARAAEDFRVAIQIDGKFGRAYLGSAWLMATCPEQRFRNPEQALQAANKAIELDGDKDYRYLDTLAAAQANAEKYDEAVETEGKVLAAAPKDETDRVQKRLDLYKDKKPFRDGSTAGETGSVLQR